MKRVICVFALLVWGATLYVWYVVHREENRYIAVDGAVVDLELQRFLVVGKKEWTYLRKTAEEQIEQFGEVIFEDRDYRFLKDFCDLTKTEWDDAIKLKGSGEQIFAVINQKRIEKAEEMEAKEEVLSMNINERDLSRLRIFIEEEGVGSWLEVLTLLDNGESIDYTLEQLQRRNYIRERLGLQKSVRK